MAVPPAAGGVLPARVGFLTIFNPSLGSGDDTIEDQIVYYASVDSQKQSRRKKHSKQTYSDPTQGISPEERDERLRQIGLAQGMTSFSRGFADGASLDAMDTEKSKLILHELEPGWWLLAVCSYPSISQQDSAPRPKGWDESIADFCLT